MTNNEKFTFLQKDMFFLLKKLHPETVGKWGVMNAQEMVEHATDFFDASNGTVHYTLAVPEEHLPKYREFLYSEKPLRENTKAPASVLGEKPMPLRTPSLEAAIEKLQVSVSAFELYFKENPTHKTMHPVFGLLNFEEWIMIHYKHMQHHLRQFGLI